MNFLESIKERAKANKKTIVLPESYEKRTLDAVSIILKEEIANVILVGDEDEINKKADGADISKATIINPQKYDKFDELVNTFYELRKAKGMTEDKARETLLKDPLYFGVMLVKANIADGMVAGAVNATANVLRPSLQILKQHREQNLFQHFLLWLFLIANMEKMEYLYLLIQDLSKIQQVKSLPLLRKVPLKVLNFSFKKNLL